MGRVDSFPFEMTVPGRKSGNRERWWTFKSVLRRWPRIGRLIREYPGPRRLTTHDYTQFELIGGDINLVGSRCETGVGAGGGGGGPRG